MKKELVTRKFNSMPPIVRAWAERAQPEAPVRAFLALTKARHGNNRDYVWLATHANGLNDLAYLALLQEGAKLAGSSSAGVTSEPTPPEIEHRLIGQAFELGLLGRIEDTLSDWRAIRDFPQDVSHPQGYIAAAMALLYKADPVKGGPHVPTFAAWLKEAQPEDLPDFKLIVLRHTKEQARRLQLNLPLLPPISHFKTMPDLAAALPADPRELEKRRRYELEAVKSGGAEQLWSNGPDEVLYTVPTMKAAQQLGRGTYWCTRHAGARERLNPFRGYKDDLLYIRRNQQVYQLHFESNEFKNAHDKSVPLSTIVAGAPGLSLALAPAIDRYMQMLARKGWAGHMADMHTKAAADAPLKAIISKAYAAQLPLFMETAARKGQADTLVSGLNVAYLTEDAMLRTAAVDSLDGKVLLAMKTIAEKGFVFSMTRLLAGVMAKPDDKLKNNTKCLFLTYLPGALYKAANKQWADDMSRTLTAVAELGDVQVLARTKKEISHYRYFPEVAVTLASLARPTIASKLPPSRPA